MATDPTGGHGLTWPRTVLYGAGNVGAGLVFAFLNGALPLYLDGYGLSNAAIGLLAQDRPPWAGTLQPIIGALSDRTSSRLGRRRPYILAGIPVAALALVLLALRPPLPVMVGLIVALTTALAVGYGPYLTLLADLVPENHRGRVNSVLGVGNMLGQILALVLAAQLWPAQAGLVFLLVAAGLLTGFVLASIGVREPPAPRRARPPLRFRPGEYLRDILGQTQLVRYLAATFFFWLGTGGVVPFLTRFAVRELGTDERTAFLLLLVAIVSSALAMVPGGWLGDRFGKKPVLFVGLVLFGVAILAGSRVASVEQAAVALAFTGLANGVCTALLFALLADLVPPSRAGELTGLGGAAWELGQPLGAVLAGLAADSTGTLRSAFLAAGVLTLLSGLLLLRVRPELAPAPVPPGAQPVSSA